MRPLTRGYIHQAAFFIAIGACLMLLIKSHGYRAFIANSIYSFTLIGLYSISSLYHCRHWSRRSYLIIRRIDHAAIFALIAGTSTPICLLGLKDPLGLNFLLTLWLFAVIGMLITFFWTHAPKWVRAFLYVTLGWLALPFLPELTSSLGITNISLLLIGGAFYTVGALFYALKWPNFFPQIFGYHEVFHLFVVIASGFHFWVIYTHYTSKCGFQMFILQEAGTI